MRMFYRVEFSTGEIIECNRARRYHINKLVALRRPDKVVSMFQGPSIQHHRKRGRQKWKARELLWLAEERQWKQERIREE